MINTMMMMMTIMIMMMKATVMPCLAIHLFDCCHDHDNHDYYDDHDDDHHNDYRDAVVSHPLVCDPSVSPMAAVHWTARDQNLVGIIIIIIIIVIIIIKIIIILPMMM